MAEVNKDTQNTNNYITKDDLVEFADKYAPQGTNTNYSLTFHNIKYEVTVPDGGSKEKEEKELILTQGTSSDLPNQKDAEGNASQVAALITSVSYHKEIYQPGCLEVVIETKAALSYFSGLVTLKCINDSIASKYYIFEKKKKSGYVTLKAYSVDKFLTIDQFCQAFTGKKLVEEIIATTLKSSKGNISSFLQNITQNNHKTTKYTLPLLCKHVVPNLRHLRISNDKESSVYYIKDGKKVEGSKPEDAESYYEVEPLIPYSVQYNESFYDFLVRICNRNGEFLFCEDNMLYVGLPDAPDKPATISESDNNGKSTGYEIEYNENYTDISNTAGNIVLNSLDASNGWPQAAAPGTLQSSRGIYPEEYNTKISDNFVDINDIQSLSSNILTGAKSIFGSRTVYEGVTAAGVAIGMGVMVSGVATNKLKKKHKKFYDNVTYQFSTSEKLLDDTFYQNILKKEEKASNGKVVVTSTSYKNHKLGDTVTIDNDKYVVCQIRGMAKNVDGLLQSDSGEEKIERYIEKFEMVLLPYDESGMAYPFPLLAKWVRTATPQRAKVTDNFDPDRLGRVRISYPWQCNDSLASPWVRIAYPMASDESGFMFTPNAGDEVLVDYENGNVERPYIVGSLYNKSTVPSWHAKTYGSTVKSITSAHGHHISFTDLPGGRFWGSLAPVTSLLGKFGLLDSVDFLNRGDSKYLGGGFEIADQYGFYSIKGSTDSRNITISSPLGDIKLDAYTGITINAPSGDVNITGKNVKIEAKNNLSLISGSNISTPYIYADEGKGTAYGASIITGLLTTVAKTATIDLSLMRTLFETIFRPIGGTLLIKSGRYMCVEAGSGKADPEKLPDEDCQNSEKAGILGHQALLPIVEYAYQNVTKCYEGYKNAIASINRFRETYNRIVGNDGLKIPAAKFQNVLTKKIFLGTNEHIKEHLKTELAGADEIVKNNRKVALVEANKDFNAIKNHYKAYQKYKKNIKATTDGMFTCENDINTFINNPQNNMGNSLRNEITTEGLKKLLFKEFQASGLQGITIQGELELRQDGTLDLGQLDTKITAQAAAQDTRGHLHIALANSWPNIFGMKNFIDNNIWSTYDEGGILISSKKGEKYRLDKQRLIEEKRSREQLVETIKNHIRIINVGDRRDQ